MKNYTCECCCFSTSLKTNFQRHLDTKKHKKRILCHQFVTNLSPESHHFCTPKSPFSHHLVTFFFNVIYDVKKTFYENIC